MTSLQKEIRKNCRILAASDRTMETIYNMIFAHGDRVMTVDASLVGKSSRKTYNQAREEIERVAGAISAAIDGATGRFIGLYGENKPAWVILFWGILKSGNTPYLINLRQPAQVTADALKSLDAVLTVCVESAPDLGTETVSYDALLHTEAQNPPSVAFADAFALSTSGTTLSKKICIYSGKNVAAQIINVDRILDENPDIVGDYKGTIKHLAFLPLYHIFGLEAVLLWYSFFGATFVFPPDMNPQNLLRTIRDHGVTHIFAVPLLWAAVEKSVRKEAAADKKLTKKLETGLKLSRTLQNIAPKGGKFLAARLFRDIRSRLFGESIVFCISGGSAVKSSTLDLINGMGYHLCNGYGMSEIGISSVDLSKKLKDRVQGTIGKPFSSVAYRIDCDGRLLVKGESLCRKMTVDGLDCPMGEWFNTGDLMTKNEKGQYLISGRASDLVFGEDGENLNPEVAEQAFSLTYAKHFTVTGDENNETLMLVVQVSENMTDEEKQRLQKEIAAANALLPPSYQVKSVWYTYDPLLAPMEIKVSRAKLRRQIKEGSVGLFDTLSDTSAPAQSTADSPLKRELRLIFAEILELTPEKITDTGHFMNDLGGSSLDYFTLLSRIDEKYGVRLEFETERFSYCLDDFVRILGERQ